MLKRLVCRMILIISLLSVSLYSAGIVANADTLCFGFVGISQSSSISFEIMNSENVDIVITNIYMQEGKSFNAFGQKNYNLLPDTKINLEVSFSPTEEGMAEDDLIIEYVLNSSVYKKKIHVEGAGEVSYYESWQSPFRVRKGTDISDYMLLSFPGQSSNLVSYLKNNFGEFNPAKWRAFIYVGRWEELTDNSTEDHAEAFFLIQNQEAQNLQLQRVLTIKDTIYEIPLNRGWNLIRNPYSFPVSTSHITLNSGIRPVFYGFNGTWKIETILYPWFGYAIYSENEDILRIHGYQQMKGGTFGKTRLDRMSRMVVRCNHYVDSLNYFGVDRFPQEIREPDLFDLPVQAYFVNSENRKLAADIRQKAEVWTFRVKAKPGERVEIIFPELPSHAIWFLRDEKGKEIRIYSGYSLMYEQKKSVQSFQIIARQSSEDKTHEIPGGMVDVFPNPGNPVVHFLIRAQKDETVTIRIFNVLGAHIKTICNSLLFKGSHLIRWNGLDESGRSVSSGIYFAQIQIGSKRIIKKLMIQK